MPVASAACQPCKQANITVAAHRVVHGVPMCDAHYRESAGLPLLPGQILPKQPSIQPTPPPSPASPALPPKPKHPLCLCGCGKAVPAGRMWFRGHKGRPAAPAEPARPQTGLDDGSPLPKINGTAQGLSRTGPTVEVTTWAIPPKKEKTDGKKLAEAALHMKRARLLLLLWANEAGITSANTETIMEVLGMARRMEDLRAALDARASIAGLVDA